MQSFGNVPATGTLSKGGNPMNWTDDASGRDPLALFADWLGAAEATEPSDPNAVALATTDGEGMPDVRMVLLKAVDGGGFVFYTNLDSAKGRQIEGANKAALCFHWKSARRQVRLRGRTEIVGDGEADDYFASRARRSQVGAWASLQSRPMDHKRDLVARAGRYAARFGVSPVPRPPRWTGIRLIPMEIEFWQDGLFRMHDRLKFERSDAVANWRTTLLYP